MLSIRVCERLTQELCMLPRPMPAGFAWRCEPCARTLYITTNSVCVYATNNVHAFLYRQAICICYRQRRPRNLRRTRKLFVCTTNYMNVGCLRGQHMHVKSEAYACRTRKLFVLRARISFVYFTARSCTHKHLDVCE